MTTQHNKKHMETITMDLRLLQNRAEQEGFSVDIINAFDDLLDDIEQEVADRTSPATVSLPAGVWQFPENGVLPDQGSPVLCRFYRNETPVCWPGLWTGKEFLFITHAGNFTRCDLCDVTAWAMLYTNETEVDEDADY